MCSRIAIAYESRASTTRMRLPKRQSNTVFGSSPISARAARCQVGRWPLDSSNADECGAGCR
eukprot:scaffold35515_cov34-Prasinocladus_malaysianus.AAC.1